MKEVYAEEFTLRYVFWQFREIVDRDWAAINRLIADAGGKPFEDIFKMCHCLLQRNFRLVILRDQEKENTIVGLASFQRVETLSGVKLFVGDFLLGDGYDKHEGKLRQKINELAAEKFLI